MKKSLFLIGQLALVLSVSAMPTNYVKAQATTTSQQSNTQSASITNARMLNETLVEVQFSDSKKMLLDFYGKGIFRMFQDPNSELGLRNPAAKPEAQILVNQPRKNAGKIQIKDDGTTLVIASESVSIQFNKSATTFIVTDLKRNKVVLESLEPLKFEKGRTSVTFKENPSEYFFGGGVQNGRFSHKGKMIAIENQNSWTDGGVASPTPFYWSTNGYGLMWYTFKKGKYDFGTQNSKKVKISHDDNYADFFIMVNDGVVPLLNDFYQLTGNPVLLPKMSLYEGHLNAYNRDYWKEDEKGILFEDGKKYKESQKDQTGIKESLNGEKNNYQFSARAVIDRYNKHDMPLGWILPNDGYGAGYGQEETLDGNIKNLKNLGEYARKNGVEIGLWTQSDLHPKDGVSALLQRDIVKEVGDAGVRVLKTDVAWVGPGYSFGLNGITDVAQIMTKNGNNARPFIISLDGWAGTQRYAGIWSGDQTGGVWEYIRFHIPTYIGSGLSGQPNITSDVDGIFGGKNVAVNVRDFQWKTFTPMQLNMDGWGSNPKYPQALDEPATSINRNYLKWKSELVPYAYSIAKESVDGLPVIRAMFTEEQNPYTLGKKTQYQFMYGPSILVAPIYQETKADKEGNDIRNQIYLPKGKWMDYFSGEIYDGNKIINNINAPLWKLPVFVKLGAIIPLTNPNNNPSQIDKTRRVYEIYPSGKTSFTEYDDDGTTQEYLNNKGAKTLVDIIETKNSVKITINKTEGDFKGMVVEKATELRIKTSQKPEKVSAKINRKKVKLSEAKSLAELEKLEQGYFFNPEPNFNRFATANTEFAKKKLTLPSELVVKLPKTDTKNNTVDVEIKGFQLNSKTPIQIKTGSLAAFNTAEIKAENTSAYTLKPTWKSADNADYYEVEFENMVYSTIKDSEYLIDGLAPSTDYELKVRAVNKENTSDWVTIKAKTKTDPLQYAIKGATAETTYGDQGGYAVSKLFDGDEGSMWHTKFSVKKVPFDVVIDLKSVNQLDKIQYLPRTDGKNGILMKGKIYASADKKTWKEISTFEWQNNFDVKEVIFTQKMNARYMKIEVAESIGNFGTGRELYIFKVPGTESVYPGDINNDKKIDSNDLTSYTNYTGLRAGDADFEGYVSNGDVNKNGLIDAYDISQVTTQLEGGITNLEGTDLKGSLDFKADKAKYQTGDLVTITVSGKDLKDVNALSFAIPYNQTELEYVQVKPIGMKNMENLTNDRLHSNGKKALYPTFVNLGDQPQLEGNTELVQIVFRAKQPITYQLKPQDILFVDQRLNSK